MKDFHKLIEITIKLDRYIDENRRFPNPKSKDRIIGMQKKIKEWVKENYDDPGIKKFYNSGS